MTISLVSAEPNPKGVKVETTESAGQVVRGTTLLKRGFAHMQKIQAEFAATTLVLRNLVEITDSLAEKLHKNNNIAQAQLGAAERIEDAVDKAGAAIEKVHDSVRNIPQLVAGLRNGHGPA